MKEEAHDFSHGRKSPDETKEKIGMVILNSLKADKSRESQP